jgi:hypothetical protein
MIVNPPLIVGVLPVFVPNIEMTSAPSAEGVTLPGVKDVLAFANPTASRSKTPVIAVPLHADTDDLEDGAPDPEAANVCPGPTMGFWT